jgi:hypothetical protein
MSKIVRLTENDLMRIVKKVIREQTSNDCDEFIQITRNTLDKYYSKIISLPEVGTSSWDDLTSYLEKIDRIVDECIDEVRDIFMTYKQCVMDGESEEWGVMVSRFSEFARIVKKVTSDKFIIK